LTIAREANGRNPARRSGRRYRVEKAEKRITLGILRGEDLGIASGGGNEAGQFGGEGKKESQRKNCEQRPAGESRHVMAEVRKCGGGQDKKGMIGKERKQPAKTPHEQTIQ